MDNTGINETRGRRRISSGAWIAVGLVAAAVIAPASAVAASNLVGIVGSNGTRAGVTTAGQLEATQTSPASIVALYSGGGAACRNAYTVPKGKGLIIDSVTFNNIDVTNPGGGTFTGLYATPKCGGHYFLDNDPETTGETSVPLTPGIALKAGTTISVSEGNVFTEVYILGYLVPSSDVTANHLPAALHHAAGAQAQR